MTFQNLQILKNYMDNSQLNSLIMPFFIAILFRNSEDILIETSFWEDKALPKKLNIWITEPKLSELVKLNDSFLFIYGLT